MISSSAKIERITDLLGLFDRGEGNSLPAPDVARVLKAELAERETLAGRYAKSEESLRQLRMIVDEGAMGMALVATDGRFLTVNPALCKMLGYLETELLDLTLDAITFPADRTLDIHQARRVWASEVRSYKTEKRYARKDGRVMAARLTVSSIRNPSGYPTFGVALLEKIEDCGPSGQRSRETDKTLEAAVAAADAGTWQWTPQTNEMLCSANLNSQLGYREGELKSSWPVFHALVHAEDARAMGDALQAHLSGSTPAYDAEFRIRHNDGSYRWLNLRGKAVLDADGKSAHVIGLALDITSRRQMQGAAARIPPASTPGPSESAGRADDPSFVHCKFCGSSDVSASRWKAWDAIRLPLMQRAFRCHNCAGRFYASKWSRTRTGGTTADADF